MLPSFCTGGNSRPSLTILPFSPSLSHTAVITTTVLPSTYSDQLPGDDFPPFSIFSRRRVTHSLRKRIVISLMASAVLARNDPCWGEPKVYVRKYPNTNTAAAGSCSETNNNSVSYNNSLFKTKLNPDADKQIRAHDLSNRLHFTGTPLPGLTGGLSSSKRESEANETSRAGHETFNLGACTRRELKDLKKRLLSDLERVRILRTRIEDSDFQIIPVYHPQSIPKGPTRAPKSQNKHPGAKRGNPFNNPKAKRAATGSSTNNAMRKCGQILTKLMKDKQGWAFNTPVDVVSLRLHDYHEIIKKPMDLGTVKSNLKSNVYKTPQEFAFDVRLTFNNALRYNPKGHYVYIMAEILSAKFEQTFEKLSQQQQQGVLVKPKARVMSLEEKIALGRNLVEVPQDEMNELWGIIKKRNGGVSIDGDEIELDIEALDDDVLWELDRFVGNYKKAISKNKIEEEPTYGEVAVPLEEEEVDIGEEVPVENYPPVVIERDDSSGSSSSSSSSSSAGSESDYDTAQSPFAEAKLD